MKEILLIVSAVLFMSSCEEDMNYWIEGKLTNLENSTVYIVFESEDYSVIDTVVCKKPGEFEIKKKLADFNQATLFLENRSVWFTVYLEPGAKIAVTGNVDYPSMFEVKGGAINNELTSFWKKQASLLKDQADLEKRLNVSNEINSIDGNDLSPRLTNITLQLEEQIIRYIQNNPQKEASAVLIQNYFTNSDDIRKLDELLITLDPKLIDFYIVKELEQYSIRAKRTALGAEAPNFSVKNVYGNTMNLDTFAHQYLLLTFTAPWCDMCQTEDLYLDKIEKKYTEKDLRQLIVSLDDDMEGVRDLLKFDSIPWNLITDSAGQASMLIDLYNVSALPRCFLIDESGKIILKTENGTEVVQTLEKLIEEGEE